MKNALILKLTNYNPASDDFNFIYQILLRADDETRELRQWLDDQMDDIEIDIKSDDQDKKLKVEKQIVDRVMTRICNSASGLIHKVSGNKIVNMSLATDTPNVVYKAAMDDDKHFYITSLSEIAISLNGVTLEYVPSREEEE